MLLKHHSPSGRLLWQHLHKQTYMDLFFQATSVNEDNIVHHNFTKFTISGGPKQAWGRWATINQNLWIFLVKLLDLGKVKFDFVVPRWNVCISSLILHIFEYIYQLEQAVMIIPKTLSLLRLPASICEFLVKDTILAISQLDKLCHHQFSSQPTQKDSSFEK